VPCYFPEHDNFHKKFGLFEIPLLLKYYMAIFL
jgi:hypothetical protein